MKENPDVHTLYLEDGTREDLRRSGIESLYKHYATSQKSYEFFEVIARKSDRFILNYYPKGQLLTICTDPGSGWSNQFIISEQIFEKLIQYGATVDDIEGFTDQNFDSILVKNQPFFNIKTNGNPSM